MTVREMIEALQALDMPDALVVRQNAGDSRAIYYERGSSWDILHVHQRKESMASSMWFGCRQEPESYAKDGETVKWAVII